MRIVMLLGEFVQLAMLTRNQRLITATAKFAGYGRPSDSHVLVTKRYELSSTRPIGEIWHTKGEVH